MGRGQRGNTTIARVSVPVSSDEQRRASKHLDVLGLDKKGASKAEIIHSYFVRGLQITEEEARAAARRAAYASFERDPERRAVSAEINRKALESGAV